jgi:colanic acid biosynthesis glycosyl transferase WcaI
VKILVLCPHFAPDVAPTGEVMTSIVTELTELGHELHVVTSLPWYRHHALEVGWEGQLVRHEETAWGRITRVHPFPTDKRNIPARAVGFAGWTTLATLEGIRSGPPARGTIGTRPDVVLAMSPPLTLGLAGWAVARARRVPFVFNIQDVFPDVAVELGLLRGERVIAAASWLERTTYRRADAVTVLSEDLAENVSAKLAGSGRAAARGARKVRVIPNFVDTRGIVPGPTDNAYRAEYGLTGKRVVMYAGNVGLSQSLDLLLDAAVALRHETDVVFVINGGGAARPELERAARGMENVRFVDMQPKARLPEVLAAGDLHVIPLKRGLARSSVPSKMYSVLAAARPIVASVDPGTEVARTVERAGAGLAVPPDDAEAFTKAISSLLDRPDDAVAMGRSGRAFVESWASPQVVARSYEALFEELRAGRSNARG